MREDDFNSRTVNVKTMNNSTQLYNQTAVYWYKSRYIFNKSNYNDTSGNNTVADTMHFFSPSLVLVTLIIYSFILIVGLIANGLAGMSQLCRPSTSARIYTCNLAVCDILLLLFYGPTQIVLIKDQLSWKMGVGMCKIVNTVLPATLCCTIGTLLAIAFDRLHALLKPFQWRLDSTKNAKLVIPLIWTVSILVDIPLIIHPQLKEFNFVQYCDEGLENAEEEEIFWTFMFIFAYAFHLLILISAYA